MRASIGKQFVYGVDHPVSEFGSTLLRQVDPDLIEIGLGQRRKTVLGHRAGFIPILARRRRPRALISFESFLKPSASYSV